MPSTYSSLKVQLMATGENNTTWGDVTNVNLGTALEEAIVGSADVAFSNANVTLTLTDTNASQTARNMRLNLTGTATSGYNLVVPSIEKPYIINNGTDGTITVKNATGTGIAVPAGKTMWVYNDGTNVVDAVTRLSSLTLGTALVVGSGGTGANTFTSNGVLLGNGTSAISATAAGTTGQVLVGNTGSAPSWATLSGIGVTSFSAGTTGLTPSTGTTGAVTLAGTLGVANGGTGATSLTSGYLVKGNGTSAASASVVYDDGTNVGIGTSSPATLLDINGALTTGNITVRGDGAEGGQITFNNLGNTAGPLTLDVDSSGNGRLFTTVNNANLTLGQLVGTGGYVAISTASSERMRIDSSGNVGIGTSSPGQKLTVAATTNQLSLTTGTNELIARASASEAALYTFQAIPLNFYTNNTERMRIDSSGNLLVGTTTADNKLTISSSSNGAAAGVLSLVNPNDAASTAADLDFVTHSSGTLATGRIRGLIGGADNYPMSFWTYGSGGLAERLRIDSSGNVGIGTSSPGNKLDVVGNAQASNLYINATAGTIGFADNSASFILYNGTGAGGITNTIRMVTNNTERMRIDGSGNVGIGTSSPDAAARLDVSSTTSGFLPPRMTTAQRDLIATPPNGLMLYNSTTDKLQVRAAGVWVDLH